MYFTSFETLWYQLTPSSFTEGALSKNSLFVQYKKAMYALKIASSI